MLAEVDGIVANGTWEVVERPHNSNIASHKWVFKVKYDHAGNVENSNHDWWLEVFPQRYGVDYSKTFAPVIRQASVRLIFTLASIFGCELKHFDFPSGVS